MSISRIRGVRIAGLASAVPQQVVETTSYADVFGADEIAKVIRATGVQRRRVAPQGMCTSDLCFAAGDRLLEDLGWERDSVDALVFVSQTADYVLPATSCLLQDRLRLPTTCAALDVNLGCSGYVYGLWVASHLVASGASRRCLLAVGEVASRRIGAKDRSAVMLFGDAGTVTALEPTEDKVTPWTFDLGTDGSGGRHLIVPAGGTRVLPDDQNAIVREYEDGNPRCLNDLYMNGAEIFLFTLNRVPKLLAGIEAAAEVSRNDVDAFVFHQANEFMLKHLVKNMGLPAEKVPLVLRNFGNTSSASIPLAMTETLASRLPTEELNLILAGFGVGLSWGAVSLRTKGVVVPPLIEVDESVIQQPLFSVPQ